MRALIRMKHLGIVSLFATVLAACGSSVSAPSGSGTPEPTVNIGYFSGGVGAPETIIGSNAKLAATVPAKLHMIPITGGLAALSEMRSGAFDLVSEVGNPPVVSAAAGGTNLRIIWVQSFDGAALMVHANITSPSQLKGMTIGDLQGSSEDFELRGYLQEQGLTSSTTVLGFPSDAAAGAAWQAGKISAAYVTIDVADSLAGNGAHQMTTAAAIAKQGFPSLNVLAASSSFIAKYPSVVQSYVCAELKATQMLTTGSAAERAAVIAPAAKLQGVPASQAIAATEQWPNIPVSQERSWLVPNPSTGITPVASAYDLTANFLKQQGTLASPPSTSTLSGLLDPSFALNALAGKC